MELWVECIHSYQYPAVGCITAQLGSVSAVLCYNKEASLFEKRGADDSCFSD